MIRTCVGMAVEWCLRGGHSTTKHCIRPCFLTLQTQADIHSHMHTNTDTPTHTCTHTLTHTPRRTPALHPSTPVRGKREKILTHQSLSPSISLSFFLSVSQTFEESLRPTLMYSSLSNTLLGKKMVHLSD